VDTRTPARFDRILQVFVVTVFLGLISLPILGMVFHLNAGALNEKRRLAPPPKLEEVVTSVSKFIADLRSYLADNFGFRSELVRWNARLSARSLAVSPSPMVVMGKDGWLYYAGEHIIEDYRCLKPFTDAELQAWTSVLERRQQWLQKRGIRYLFVVGPNEHTIYPEYLPSYITRVRDTSRLDQLLDYLKAHSTVPTVDLRPALLAGKAKERVYQKTDTHWNARGAFIAYQEMFKPIHEWFPMIQATPRDRFQDTVTTEAGGDLANMMGMTDVYQEEVLGLRPLDPRQARFTEWPPEKRNALPSQPYMVQESEIPGSKLPRLVLFHDSFGNALKPFVAEHFSRAVYAFNAMIFDKSILDQEKPDLVIQEITERYLWGEYANIYANQLP
jgi:alginate O-acetyltransferase complex protein AlgJ